MAYPTQLVSITSAGVAGNGNSGIGGSYTDVAYSVNENNPMAAIGQSSNGKYIVFTTSATNFSASDTNGYRDVYLKDMGTGSLTRVTPNTGYYDSPEFVKVSDDGRYVSYSVSNVVYRKDMLNSTLEIVSKNASNIAINGTNSEMSADGRYIVFESSTGDNAAGHKQIYVRDMQNGTTTIASVDTNGVTVGTLDSTNASISDDGQFVVFQSKAENFSAGNANATNEIFMKNLETGELTRISEKADHTGGALESINAEISQNGKYVFFESASANLAPITHISGVTLGEIFRKNIATGEVEIVSTGVDGTTAGIARGQSVTADGRFVLFKSELTNHNDALSTVKVPTNPGFWSYYFIKDTATGNIYNIDVPMAAYKIQITIPGFGTHSGPTMYWNTAESLDATISADGHYVVLSSPQTLDKGTIPLNVMSATPTSASGDPFEKSNEDGQYDVFRIDVSKITSLAAKAVTVKGSVGDDIDLTGGFGKDTLDGGAGNDSYKVDLIQTGSGAKAIAALKYFIKELSNNGIDTLKLTGGNFDLLKATLIALPKFVENLDISATGQALLDLKGAIEANLLTGNAAKNLIDGQAGNDTLIGGAGDDTLVGGVGIDSLAGGLGDDTYIVNVNETLEGLTLEDIVTENNAEGQDTLKIIGLTKTAQTLDLANFSNIENLDISLMKKAVITLQGDSGENVLIGNAANNQINGAEGNNTINGGLGNDSMTGGAGNDTYYVDSKLDAITDTGGQDTVVSLQKAYTLIEGMENLTLLGKVAQQGTGNTADNQIIGNEKGNVLSGLVGSDTINGSLGNDTLIGGDGNDVYLFDTNLKGNLDHIQDFAQGDLIGLDHLVFTKLSLGALSINNFEVGAAVAADDYILYQNGSLYYDADSSGSGVAIKFATLDKVAGITFDLQATDIYVY